jgi:SAM-dependent methyltransferase
MSSPNTTPGRDYQRNVSEYDQFWSQRFRRTHTYSNQTKLKRFRALIRRHGLLDKPLRVFDQGFGLGAMLFAFPTGASIAGLEMSQSAVDAATVVARSKGYKEVDLRVFTPGVAYPSEWKGCFDLVISSHVLEHIAEPKPALAELLSLLKPGGFACIVVPINERPGEDLNHFHYFTVESFREFLTGSGLSLLEVLPCDRLHNLVKPLSSRLQRGPSKLDRVQSICFNLAFGFMPLVGMILIDRLLSLTSWKPCQCFALCRKAS